jgi:ABC-type bacteriocin/lantibiotic exporter with double-glycine peptidase domain
MLTSLEKVSKILDKPEEKESGASIIEMSSGNGIAIRAENIFYRFNDNDNYILKNLNFEIKAGEKVCVFGTEGSGKTSLLKLFTGAYLHYQGNLLFNNYPLGDFNLEILRNEIGVYMAADDLFSGTLAENLTLGDETISHQTILKIAEETGLLPFIQSLKGGLSAPIDSAGKKLPRNTINKILVTRAFLSQPKLLLLEDCWSALEKEEQEKMVAYLTHPNHTYTLICITNDANFASKCDKVILLEEGKIVACDTFVAVSAKPIYEKMFKQLSL